MQTTNFDLPNRPYLYTYKKQGTKYVSLYIPIKANYGNPQYHHIGEQFNINLSSPTGHDHHDWVIPQDHPAADESSTIDIMEFYLYEPGIDKAVSGSITYFSDITDEDIDPPSREDINYGCLNKPYVYLGAEGDTRYVSVYISLSSAYQIDENESVKLEGESGAEKLFIQLFPTSGGGSSTPSHWITEKITLASKTQNSIEVEVWENEENTIPSDRKVKGRCTVHFLTIQTDPDDDIA